MHKYLSKPAILFFVLFSAVMYAQSNTQTVCTGGVSKMEKTYTVGGGASGSTYNWTVTSQTSGLDLVFSPPLPTTASITIDWKPISSGVYKVKVTGGGSPFPCLSIDPSSCSGSSSSGEVTVTIKNDKNLITSVDIIIGRRTDEMKKVCTNDGGNGDKQVIFEAKVSSSSSSSLGYTYTWVVPNNINNGNKPMAIPLVPPISNKLSLQGDPVDKSEFKVTVTDISTKCEYFASNKLVVNPRPTIIIQRACGDAGNPPTKFEVAKTPGTAKIIGWEWFSSMGGNDIRVGTGKYLGFPVSHNGCNSCIPSIGAVNNRSYNSSDTYKVSVTDDNGCTNNTSTIYSNNILRQPIIEIKKDTLSTSKVAGGEIIEDCNPVTLRATNTDSNIPVADISFQWKKNGSDIFSGADYTINSSNTSTGDVYTVTATAKNPNGSSSSSQFEGCSSDPNLEASSFANFKKGRTTSSVLVKIGVGNAPDFKFDTSTPPGSKVEEISPAPLAPPEYTASFCTGNGNGVKLKAIPSGVTTNLVGLQYEWKSGIPPNTTALVPAKSGTITSADDGSYNAMAVGDYTLTIKNGSTGCPKSKTVRVTESKVPVVTVEYKTGPLCIGVNLEAKTTDAAASSYQYQWYRQIGSGVMLPVQTGGTTYIDNERLSTTAANEIRTYAVDVTYGLCTKRFFPDPNNGKIFNPPIDVSIKSTTGRSTSCKSEGIILKATVNPPCGTRGCSYEWKENGSTSAVLNTSTSDSIYKAKLSGTYTVAVTKAPDTCPYTSPGFIVTLNPNPTVVINDSAGAAVTALEICERNSTTLTLVAAGTTTAVSNTMDYKWQKNDGNMVSRIGGNSKNYPIPPDTAVGSADYTVTVTDFNGCTSEASSPVKVTVNREPSSAIVTVPVNTYEFCADPGASVLLKATDAYLSSPPGSFSFEWRKDSNPTPVSTVGSYNATDTGTYTLKVTDTGHPLTNCSSTSTPITVTKKPLPVTEEIKHD